MTTRDRIIYESLKLFSVNGFDAVSTRMIAKAAGVSDTAMYKHFRSKQEIFDTIILVCKERFLEQRNKIDIYHLCWKDVEQICMDMFRFQIEDEWIVMFRQLLVIEQFKNQEIARLYQSFFVDTVIDGQAEIFEKLIAAGYMKACNPRVLAMELYAPFFMYHIIRPDERKVLETLREHVTYFRNNYKTELSEKVSKGMHMPEEMKKEGKKSNGNDAD